MNSEIQSLDIPTVISARFGQQGEVDGVYASTIKYRCQYSLRGTVPDTLTSLVLLIFAFAAIKHPQYVNDYIFIRFSFVNKASIVVRRILSVFLNALLFFACIATIIMCLVRQEDLFSSYSSGYYDGLYMPVIISFLVPFLFAIWAITSLFWWVLDKK